MEFPQEIEVWYVIPAVRRELAKRLVATGLTQRSVAKKLDVTEAAVSQYLSNKRGTTIDYPKKVAQALAEASARLKASDDPQLVRKEILDLCRIMKEEKVICDIHRKNGFDADGCTTCFE